MGGSFGGFIKKAAEIGTGGLIQSGDTKAAEGAATQAQAMQAKLVKEEKLKVQKEEDERKKRAMIARQGNRSLLWQGTDERGVQKKETLGG